MTGERSEPEDSFQTPRFTGPRTFMRLPYRPNLDDVEELDVAFIGIPTDDAVSYRSGARFGPEAIRSASVLLRSFNPELRIDVAAALSIIDHGDAPTVPGYHEETLDRVSSFLRRVHERGVIPLCVGGDHSMALAELRAAAAVHGPLALVHFDAHADVIDQYYGVRYFHGTVFRRAVEEGLVDPSRSIQAGMRGSLPSADDLDASADLGFELIQWRTLETIDPSEFGERVRARVGETACFVSFDIDFVDPAFAPGTGTPEVGGPTSAQALRFLRAIQGVDIRACDCVEVSPPFDGDGITALLASTVCFELLSLIAARSPAAERQGG